MKGDRKFIGINLGCMSVGTDPTEKDPLVYIIAADIEEAKTLVPRGFWSVVPMPVITEGVCTK